MLDIKTILMLEKNIILRSIGKKYWALDTSNGNQYRLNEVSYFILELFHQPLSIEKAMEPVLKEYDVERERLIADCENLWQFAVSRKILKEVSA